MQWRTAGYFDYIDTHLLLLLLRSISPKVQNCTTPVACNKNREKILSLCEIAKKRIENYGSMEEH